jgi:hypothetical protein
MVSCELLQHNRADGWLWHLWLNLGLGQLAKAIKSHVHHNELRVRSELNLNFRSYADASWRHGKCIVLSFSRIFRSGGFTVAHF